MKGLSATIQSQVSGAFMVIGDLYNDKINSMCGVLFYRLYVNGHYLVEV